MEERKVVLGLAFAHGYLATKECEEVARRKNEEMKKNLVDWLDGTDSETIAKVIDVIGEAIFKVLLSERGTKVEEVLRYLGYEWQKKRDFLLANPAFLLTT